MRIITRGRAIVEGAVVAALALGLAFNIFGCSAGGTTYGSGSSSNTTSGTQSGTQSGTTSSTSGYPNGDCASVYTPNYVSLWNTGANQGRSGVWTHSPIKIYFGPDLTVPTPGGTTSYEQQVLTGFNEWTSRLGGGITYTQVTSAANADVTVSFATDSSTTNSAKWSSTATATNLAFSNVTVTFSASATGTETTALLQLMGAEAFGAVLGLPASTSPSDITNTATTATAPSTSDINTVKALYCSYY